MVAIVKKSLGRLQRGIRRHGLWTSIRRAASQKFNRLFRARLCVWVWNSGEELAAPPTDVEVLRFDSPDQLPQSMLEELVAGDTSTFASRMNEEFSEGGVLWIARIDRRVAGYQWSRNGKLVENWHFDLDDRDTVIYSTVTLHEFRGRGVARAVMGAICRDEVASGGRACVDCMVWNTPAVRFIQRTGFTKVAEARPFAGHPD